MILFLFSHVSKNNTCIEVNEFWYIYCHIWILIIYSYWNFPLFSCCSFPRSPGCPSLSPTNVRHFLTSPVVNLATSYPRATKKKHQNVKTLSLTIDEIQTKLASIASLWHFKCILILNLPTNIYKSSNNKKYQQISTNLPTI